jgi:hypothetical protein
MKNIYHYAEPSPFSSHRKGSWHAIYFLAASVSRFRRVARALNDFEVAGTPFLRFLQG